MANGYLIEGSDGMILVDSGSPGREAALYSIFDRLGRDDLKLIVITHAHLDHFGSAAAIRRRTGAPIAIGVLDAEAMAMGRTDLNRVRGRGVVGKALLPIAERILKPKPTSADIHLDDGERFEQAGMTIDVVHTPGHTVGSISLMIDEAHAFVGDLLSTTLSPHIQRLYASDWNQILPSLERVRERQPDILYPGHGRAPLGKQAFCLLLDHATD